MFFSVDDGCFLIFSSGTSKGPTINIFYVDGGRSQISVSTSQCPPSTFLSVDGGRSRISSSGTSQGAHRQCFLALMVGACGSPTPAPPRRPTIDVS
jgi:hypothetical protein